MKELQKQYSADVAIIIIIINNKKFSDSINHAIAIAIPITKLGRKDIPVFTVPIERETAMTESSEPNEGLRERDR